MMYELTDADLDAVAAGQTPQQFLDQLGVVNLGVPIQVGDIDVTLKLLDNNQIEIENVANNNTIQVGVGAAVAILGGVAAGLVRQLG
jgi:hypothetical protein